jgi:hypothetical protein
MASAALHFAKWSAVCQLYSDTTETASGGILTRTIIMLGFGKSPVRRQTVPDNGQGVWCVYAGYRHGVWQWKDQSCGWALLNGYAENRRKSEEMELVTWNLSGLDKPNP